MTRSLVLFASLALAGITAAHADTVTYNFTNTMLENKGSPKIDGTLTGSVTFDPSNPLVLASWDSSFEAAVGSPEVDYTFSGEPTSVKAGNNGGIAYYKAVFSSTSSPVTAFDLFFTDVSGVITLCDRSGVGQACGASVNTFLDTTPGNEDAIVGSLVATTPEPSSLVLLGTGIVGLAGMARRKFLRA